MANTFTTTDIGCYFDGARGIYTGEAIQEMAQNAGWDAWTYPNAGVLSPNHENCDGVKDGVEGHAEIDHAQFYSEITDDAEEFLNNLTSDDVWFGSSESGDWGLWHICDADNDAPEHCKVCDY